MASGAADGTVRLAGIHGGEDAQVFQHPSGVMALAASRTGVPLLAAGLSDGSIVVRRIPPGEECGSSRVWGASSCWLWPAMGVEL